MLDDQLNTTRVMKQVLLESFPDLVQHMGSPRNNNEKRLNGAVRLTDGSPCRDMVSVVSEEGPSPNAYYGTLCSDAYSGTYCRREQSTLSINLHSSTQPRRYSSQIPSVPWSSPSSCSPLSLDNSSILSTSPPQSPFGWIYDTIDSHRGTLSPSVPLSPGTPLYSGVYTESTIPSDEARTCSLVTERYVNKPMVNKLDTRGYRSSLQVPTATRRSTVAQCLDITCSSSPLGDRQPISASISPPTALSLELPEFFHLSENSGSKVYSLESRTSTVKRCTTKDHSHCSDSPGRTSLANHTKPPRRASMMVSSYASREATSLDNPLDDMNPRVLRRSRSHPIIYAVIDSQFEKLCRDVLPSPQTHKVQYNPPSSSTGVNPGKNKKLFSTPKKRNRVIFCRICNEVKPRSTRTRFQSCNHIACYDCVRIALHVEFWAVKTNSTRPAPRAVCPACHTPLDWSSIKPYIVLAEEAKYSPVLSLAFSGKDIPSNAVCRSPSGQPLPRNSDSSAASAELTPIEKSTETSAAEGRQRLKKTYEIIKSFFPFGVDMDLVISDTCNVSDTLSGQCISTLLGLQLGEHNKSDSAYVDLLDKWRKELLSLNQS